MSIKDNVNETLIKNLGITYDEYEKLDFDEQQMLIREYHRKHPDKSKETIVMIGGGDESIFIKAKKGEKILTSNGYIIAGETLEENKKRWESKMDIPTKKHHKITKKNKLDFKTWFNLHLIHAVIVEHVPVKDVAEKRTMFVKDSKNNEMFIFDDYEEYRKYYSMYLKYIDEELIKLAIFKISSKGQVIAFKGLCERLILKSQVKEFYDSLTDSKIDEIHSHGKLSPLEAVEMWESYDLCIEGSKSIHSKSRCDYFNGNCHECLLETASHNLEHDPINLEITNSNIKEKESVKVLTRF